MLRNIDPMNILSLEDSLDEFDIRYMEACRQVDCVARPQKLLLSLPLLGSQFSTFTGPSHELPPPIDIYADSVSPRMLLKRPALKPLVTIASIETYRGLQRCRSLPRKKGLVSKEDHRKRTPTRVGNPYYKPSLVLLAVSVELVPQTGLMLAVFDLQADDYVYKRRKLSDPSLGVHPFDHRFGASDTSLSSLDSVLSREPCQFEAFDNRALSDFTSSLFDE